MLDIWAVEICANNKRIGTLVAFSEQEFSSAESRTGWYVTCADQSVVGDLEAIRQDSIRMPKEVEESMQPLDWFAEKLVVALAEAVPKVQYGPVKWFPWDHGLDELIKALASRAVPGFGQA